jgi:hypothetical protein
MGGFYLALCARRILHGVYVLMRVLASVFFFVLCGFDVWCLHRYFLCALHFVLTVSGVFIPCDLYWGWAQSSLCHGQFQTGGGGLARYV